MASTTPFAPNQTSGFTAPQNVKPNPNFNLNGNMTIGQFGLPQTSGTTSPNFSPTQGGSIDLAGGHGITPTTPTSTGFQAGSNGTITGNGNSVWNNPAVHQNPIAKDTKISSLPPTPPASSVPANLNQGAAAGGGLTPEQIAAAKATENQYSNDPSINPNATGGTPQTTNPNPAANAQSSNPISDTSSQTDAIIKNLQAVAGQGSQGDQAEQDLQSQIKNLETSIGLGQGQILSTPEPLSFQTGQQAALLAQRNPELQALTNQLASLQANRSASINAGTNAGGLANTLQGLQQQTTPVGIGTGLYAPFSGRTVASNAAYMGGANGGTDSIMQGLVQQLQNGASWSDVVSQLPSVALAPMLSQAAAKAIPGFNPTTSNQNAQARGSALQQQATDVRPMVNSQQTAIQHLDNLGNILKQINYSNVPFVNGVRDWFSNNVNKDPNIAQAQSELNVVRSEVAKVLGGGNVTVESQHEAESVVPTDITPDTFQRVSDNVKTLMQSKIAQAQNLGNIQQFPAGNNQNQQTNGTSSPYDW